MTNLFLEGDSETGKTSLILKMLAGDIRTAGGYSTVRLHYADKSTAGYYVKPASQMSVTDEEFDSGLANIFLQFTSQGCIKKEDVFVRFASEALEKGMNSPFMVMDEFGGIELTDRTFTEQLRRVIASPIPVIGVIKSRRNAARLMEAVNPGREYSEVYESLRSFIEGTDSVIVNIQESGVQKSAELIEEWKQANLREKICGRFTTA